ncbi:hypothetical protein F3Y22_tig00112523pilonHSYRG00020 [Hibiscus syriacus]|uniref:RING-CH-type domain-containing protein n=1 Tax=Hibiscus syriacus TaxID=106335 RepID=A0A6A2X9E7_HIBSY|nr:hypothetical protein F3Y22_tig00112523pilonHSYRG00020 [Hibiscus syriacus]
MQEAEVAGSWGEDSSIVVEPDVCAIGVEDVEEHGSCDEEEPLILTVECRICQDEDSIENLEAPCSCSGSLKFAHRKCIQRWCNEKGDLICEICHQFFFSSHYLVTFVVIWCITCEWTVSCSSLGYQLILAVAAERPIFGQGYDAYSDNDSSGAEFFRAASLTISLLRAAGLLLPCYIVSWTISILQRRREQQEAAADVAVMIQSSQPRAMHYSVALGPLATPQQEPLQ